MIRFGTEFELLNVTTIATRNIVEETFESFITLERDFLEGDDIRSSPLPQWQKHPP
jgi:hypothetical protein